MLVSPLLGAAAAEARHLPGLRNHLSPKTGPGRDRRPTRPMGPIEQPTQRWGMGRDRVGGGVRAGSRALQRLLHPRLRLQVSSWSSGW